MHNNGWVTLALLLLLSSGAHGFDGRRHKTICQHADKHLSSAVQVQIQQLLSTSPAANLGVVCRWPDQVKKQRRYRHTRSWHYVNLARSARTLHDTQCSNGQCVTQQLAQHWQQLQTQPDWQTLAFVGHLLADLHQPMHVSYADDAGGNRYSIWWHAPLVAGVSKTSLHRYWDGQLLDERDLQLPWAKLAFVTCNSDCPEIYPHTLAAKQALISDWAAESFVLTHQIYRSLDDLQSENKVRQQALPLALRQNWQQQLTQRMNTASQRLHWLLQQTLVQPSASLTDQP